MIEKFGVEFVAVVDKFKAKVNEIKQMGANMKDDFMLGMSVDYSEVEKLSEKSKEAKNTLEVLNNSKFAQLGQSVRQAGENIKKAFTFESIKGKIKNFGSAVKNAMSGIKKDTSTIPNSIRKMGDSFQGTIKKVKKFALALLSVRTVFSAVSRASQAYLSFDRDLSDKLQSAWAGLGAQLAPIIEYLVNLFAKAIAYVNAFVKALTGINMVARANAKALNKQSGAAKNASKSLSAMDEITNIDDNAGGGGGDAPQIELPEVDTSKLENALNRIKEIASTLFEPIQNAWNTYGDGVIKSIKFALEESWGLIKEIGKSFLEVWTNGTGEKTVGWILQIFTDIFNIIGGIRKALKDAWAENDTGTQIIQFIADIFNSILEFAQSITNSLKKWVLSESFQNAIKVVLKILKDLIGYISDIASWIVDMYKKYLAPVVDEVLLLISDIINMIGAIWEVVKPVVDKVVSILKTVLEPVISTLGQMIKVVIQTIRVIVDVITWVAKNWNIIWNGMKNVAKAVVNGIIGFMNLWIKGLNAMLLPLRTTISLIAKAFGKDVSIGSIKIPSIPKLDSGTGYVPEDQMAYIHKGEAVIPKKFNSAEYFSNINDNTETNNLLLEANRTLINILEKDNSFYVNGKELARTTYNDFQQEGNRINKNNIVKVG